MVISDKSFEFYADRLDRLGYATAAGWHSARWLARSNWHLEKEKSGNGEKMPPSAPGAEDSRAVVRKLLREVLVGREDPEGFFAMCLSVLGHRETRSQLPSLIQPLSTANRSLHSSLTSIYQEYFSTTEDDELELALALSVLEMKDHQMLAPSQESRLQQPEARPKQSSSVQPPSVSPPQGSSHTQTADVPRWKKTPAQHKVDPGARHVHRRQLKGLSFR
ncbi:hypothetical protein INR49_007855 [Caranx melampygus]|nr:hypothetical protein INR49_007855 [Caranx melampygus]